MGLLRAVALAEGTAFLLLLLVAVPLKHLAGIDAPVLILGPLHGIAFLSYVWLIARLAVEQAWSPGRAIRLAAAGLLPLGAFVALRSLSSHRVKRCPIIPC